MDAEFAEEEVVENPTLKAAYNLAPLHQNQPLRWDHKVDLLGEKIYDKIIHLCEHCELPILVYGRMLPCKHVFCFDCARTCKNCKRCGLRVQKVEKSALGTVFVCTHGAPKHCTTGCRRTYLSQRDLQSHIFHRHVPKTTAESKISPSVVVSSLPLPLTQQQAAQQAGQQAVSQGGGVHTVTVLGIQSHVTPQLQVSSHSGVVSSQAMSQQHSPVAAHIPNMGVASVVSSIGPTMPHVTASQAPLSAPSILPYNSQALSSSDHSVYRPLDIVSVPQQKHQLQPHPVHQQMSPHPVHQQPSQQQVQQSPSQHQHHPPPHQLHQPPAHQHQQPQPHQIQQQQQPQPHQLQQQMSQHQQQQPPHQGMAHPAPHIQSVHPEQHGQGGMHQGHGSMQQNHSMQQGHVPQSPNLQHITQGQNLAHGNVMHGQDRSLGPNIPYGQNMSQTINDGGRGMQQGPNRDFNIMQDGRNMLTSHNMDRGGNIRERDFGSNIQQGPDREFRHNAPQGSDRNFGQNLPQGHDRDFRPNVQQTQDRDFGQSMPHGHDRNFGQNLSQGRSDGDYGRNMPQGQSRDFGPGMLQSQNRDMGVMQGGNVPMRHDRDFGMNVQEKRNIPLGHDRDFGSNRPDGRNMSRDMDPGLNMPHGRNIPPGQDMDRGHVHDGFDMNPKRNFQFGRNISVEHDSDFRQGQDVQRHGLQGHNPQGHNLQGHNVPVGHNLPSTSGPPLMGQGNSSMPLGQNPMHQGQVSKQPYGQGNQSGSMPSGMMPPMNSRHLSSPTPQMHSGSGPHMQDSPRQGAKAGDNFNNPTNIATSGQSIQPRNVNLITVPIQDEGQFRPQPFVNLPHSEGSQFIQGNSGIQNPQTNLATSNVFPKSNNPQQMGIQRDNIPTGNAPNMNFNHASGNQGLVRNINQGIGSNMPGNNMPRALAGVVQAINFAARNQGPGLLNPPGNTNQMGSARFNAGNRWSGPRGMQPRMNQGPMRPRGDGGFNQGKPYKR